MCGIAGYVQLDGRPLTKGRDDLILGAMGDAMRHRGPDDTQLMLWQNVGFVFKRLSIVDVDGGRQPIEIAGGRISAMVNGEIYNHREIRATLAKKHVFHTQSDSEVIPHLYLEHDLGLFESANGIFAVALLDREKRRLLLGRDHAGVKPLFYYVSDDGKLLVFASELKALFAHRAVPREFDWPSAFADWFVQGTAPRELPSGFRGIKRVPAAGMLDVSLIDGRCRLETYWQLPARGQDSPVRPASYYVDRYRDLLADSVRLQLMSDVPYGVFLSGGIDSAAVTALAAQAGPFPTFSVLSRSTVGSGDAEAAREVAVSVGVPNHQLLFDERNIGVTPDDWRRILWSCEMFPAGPEQLFKYYLHAFAKQQYPGLKVILLGQGSDEFNGGYISHALGQKGAWTPADWIHLDDDLQATATTQAARLTGLTDSDVDLMLSGVLDRSCIGGARERDGAQSTWDRYVGRWRQNLDIHLWHEDRTAAAHGIEDRVPFLDYRILELLATIPEQHHAELFVDKRILRRAAAGLLPASIAERRKGYFFVGRQHHHALDMMYAILSANGGELVEQAIAGSLRTGGPFAPDRFRAYFRDVGGYRTIKQLTRAVQLVNMGVLADLAASQWTPPSGPSSLPMREVVLDDWARSPAGQRALRSSNWTEPPDDMVVGFAPGTSLVEVKSAGVGVPAPGSAFLVLEDGRLTSAIESPQWSRFLACVDGKRTIAGILSLLQLTKKPLLRFLNAALDDGVLIEVEDTLRGAATGHYLPQAYSGSAVEPQNVTVLPQKFD
jgi:asparagine synthase (glutamine-hydrolysing)